MSAAEDEVKLWVYAAIGIPLIAIGLAFWLFYPQIAAAGTGLVSGIVSVPTNFFNGIAGAISSFFGGLAKSISNLFSHL